MKAIVFHLTNALDQCFPVLPQAGAGLWKQNADQLEKVLKEWCFVLGFFLSPENKTFNKYF